MTSQTGYGDNKIGHDNEGFTNETATEDNQNNGGFEKRSTSKSSKSAEATVSPTIIDADDKVDLSCGIWKLRTNIFGRRYSNLYVFSIFVGLSTFFTLMVQTIFQIQLKSIQNQFKLDNAETGLFDTASRIGSVCTILFAGHFAKKVHIPMVIGLAGVIQGIVLMVPAFIQFADPFTLPSPSGDGSSSKNETNDNEKYYCKTDEYLNNGTNSNTTSNSTSADVADTNHVAFAIIVAVQALKGITDSFHAGFLPALYVDDNMMDKTKMGIFFGINSIITEIATPIGKQINGVLSNVPVDLSDTQLTAKDDRFVAAWWLAFLVFGAGTVIFSIPVMLFPKKLLSKGQQEQALKKAMVSFTSGVMVEDDAAPENTNGNESEKNPIASTKRENSPRPDRKHGRLSLAPRISNQSGIFDVTNLNNIRRTSLLPPVHGPSTRRISIDGTMIFDQPIKPRESVQEEEPIQGSASLKELIKDFPKAFIRILRRPVFILIIIDIFAASIPMAGLAMFRSVYMTNEYNVTMSDVATLSAVTQIVGQLLGTFVSGFLANRVKTKMGYNYIILGTHLASLCITPFYIIFGCNNENVYGHVGDFGVPVNTSGSCGCSDKLPLISCGDDGNNYLSPCYAGCINSPSLMRFTNCSVLNTLNQTINLTSGLCPTNCRPNFLLYVILHAVQVLLSSMSTIPMRLLILRIVDPRDRGFATSIFAFCGTIVAIPSPNIFGRVIDGTCLVRVGKYCSLYDRDKIRYLLSGVDIAVSVFLQLTMFAIIFLFRREEKQMLKKLEEEKKQKENAIINVKL